MSQVLQKPVILDETGQIIVSKLEEIKSAISSSGEYIPLAIRITTPPTKTAYHVGDALDLTGIIISLVGSNGSLVDITSACTFSPANGTILSASDTEIIITYHYDKDNIDFNTTQTITVTSVVATSIAVTTAPIKINYIEGESLDLTGIVVTATYNDSSTADVTENCTFSPADGATLSDNISAITISYSDSGNILTTTQNITVRAAIYGVEWDGSASSIWSRTDDAADFVDPIAALSNGDGSSPFDAISPWKDMQRVEDETAGILVSIPKYYWKWENNKLQISIKPFSGASVSPAHMDRGDGNGERDIVYIGAYHCASSTLKSESGVYPEDQRTRQSFRNNIHNLGSDIWQFDIAMYWTIAMLYLVEYADWNSQAKIGYGAGTGSTVSLTGQTDAMIYHTGTDAADRTSLSHVRYRYIEDLWANVNDYCDGIYYSSNDVYGILNPANFSDNANGTKIGTRSAYSGIIKSFNIPSASGLEFMRYPAGVKTSPTTADYETYICDTSDYGSSGTVLLIGGSSGLGSQVGLFHFMADRTGSNMYRNDGGRLQKLPNNS